MNICSGQNRNLSDERISLHHLMVFEDSTVFSRFDSSHQMDAQNRSKTIGVLCGSEQCVAHPTEAFVQSLHSKICVSFDTCKRYLSEYVDVFSQGQRHS